MPILYYFFTWVLVTFLQVVVAPRLSIMGIYPDILTAFIVIIALKQGRITALWMAFALALSIDLLDPAKLGWMTLILSIIGYFMGVIRDTLYFENPWFEATMILLATFIFQLAYRFFPAPQFFAVNSMKMISEAAFISIYTVAVAGLIIWVIRQGFQVREML